MCLHTLLNQLHLLYWEYNVVATNNRAKTFYKLEETSDTKK
jgi:hypothetical protein